MSYAKVTWVLLRRTVTKFTDDNAMRLAAALAYYTALSLAPLLLLVVSIAGTAYEKEAATDELRIQLEGLMGKDGAKAVQDIIRESQPREGGIVSGVIGLITLLVGATGVFAQLQDSLNTVWNVDPQKVAAGGLWGMVKARLLSFSMVCGMAFLLLVSLLLTGVMHALNGVLVGWWPGLATALGWGNTVLSIFLTFAMFAMIFKVLPQTRMAWSDVWFGAAITTLLFEVGRNLIGLYIGKAAPGSTFGAAGSFVVVLVWLYYSSVIVLFGAEFTQVYATRRGTVKPGSPAAREAAAVAATPPAVTTPAVPPVAAAHP